MKKISFFIAFLIFGLITNAQIKKPTPGTKPGSNGAGVIAKDSNAVPFYKKLKYGMTIGNISFGSNFGIVSLGPIIYYPITERFSVGTMLQYTYAYERYYLTPTSTLKINTHIFAPDIYAQYNFIEQAFVRTDFEYGITKAYDGNTINPITGEYVKVLQTYPSLFLGLGYQPGNGFIMIQYNLAFKEEKSLYNAPLRYVVGILF